MQQGSGEHIAALVVLAVGVGVAVWAPRRHGGPCVVPVMRGLALVILAMYIAEYVANAVEGTWSARHNLPLHLTDAVTLVAVAALWTPRPSLVEVVYFWALTASLQAVLSAERHELELGKHHLARRLEVVGHEAGDAHGGRGYRTLAAANATLMSLSDPRLLPQGMLHQTAARLALSRPSNRSPGGK